MHRPALASLVLLAVLGAPAAMADDPDPPTFKSLAVGAGDHGPGDLVPVQVRWEDASGVTNVWLNAVGPNGLVLWTQCEDPGGERVAIVDCTVHLKDRSPRGRYLVSHVGATDAVGHRASAAVDVPFAVTSPFDDATGPTLSGVDQNLTVLDLRDVSVPVGQPVVVDDAFVITARDDSNVTYAHLDFRGPNGNQGLHAQCDSWSGHKGLCQLFADPQVPAGDYRLNGIQVNDEVGYVTQYLYRAGAHGKELADVLPTPLVLRVESPRGDDEEPIATGLSFPGSLHRGQPFELWLNATDASTVEAGHVVFRTVRGNAGYSVSHGTHCEGAPGEERRMRCVGRFPDNFPLGLAVVEHLSIEDDAGNRAMLRPVQLAGPGERSFADDEDFDVATVLAPRPVEGVLEAIDALLNEVLPGEVATLVYHTRDAVDDVVLVLADAVDGSRIEISCADAVPSPLGQECDFVVPTAEEGILSLVSATISDAQGHQASTYAPGEVPLLAVHRQMPASSPLPLARGGGAMNDVGTTWHTEFTRAREQGTSAPVPSAGASGGGGGVTAPTPAPMAFSHSPGQAAAMADAPLPTRFNVTRLESEPAGWSSSMPADVQPPPEDGRESPGPAWPWVAAGVAAIVVAKRRRAG